MKKILICTLTIIILVVVLKVANVKRIILRKMYVKDYSEYVYEYATEYNVDPLLVFAVIKAESNFKKDATSTSNAIGLMQLMDSTADEVASNIITDTTFESNMLFDAKTNIKIGTKYLSELLQKYDGNYYLAVAAYNAGIGNVTEWIQKGIIKKDGTDIENIPFKETNNYVRKILRDYEIYREIYEV